MDPSPVQPPQHTTSQTYDVPIKTEDESACVRVNLTYVLNTTHTILTRRYNSLSVAHSGFTTTAATTARAAVQRQVHAPTVFFFLSFPPPCTRGKFPRGETRTRARACVYDEKEDLNCVTCTTPNRFQALRERYESVISVSLFSIDPVLHTYIHTRHTHTDAHRTHLRSPTCNRKRTTPPSRNQVRIISPSQNQTLSTIDACSYDRYLDV